jgi:acyl carrier protein
MSESPERTWDELANAVAEIARVERADIGPDTRLVDDLHLDSLALAQLAVTLIVDFDMGWLSDELERRQWSGITAGELYERRCAGEQTMPGDRFRFHVT